MRNPIRGEPDAFALTAGAAALIAASLGAGAAVAPIAGVALLVGGGIGALVWELSGSDPDRRRPLREAAAEGRRAAASSTARRRVLVIANRTLQGPELEAILRRLGAAGAQLRVVAPIVVSRAHYLASDVDRELAEARERLAAALAWAREEGLEASGTVGDPNVALGAIEDELRVFAADEVVISTYPPGRSNWLETGVVARLRDELEIPVTHVTVDGEPAAAATHERHASAA
jgi:GABA permease